ncbi:MAG: hypothetical protein IPK72_25665 [Candidatus Eisenbacteria bacterium]|nr:hypothetical protein [Candidatus Eisenbacteria bacterium]
MSPIRPVRALPVPRTAKPKTPVGRWLLGPDEHQGQAHDTHPWWMVLWLTGVDYFSTLGYQPGIALLAAGALAPVSTALLVLVTLLGALPIYSQVAARSYAGQGSIAMLESLLPGWMGKLFVLVMLGFAATDFVITITLSAADAAQHAIENPLFHAYLGDARMPITLGLMALLALVFLKGFAEAIGVAAAVAVPYLLLNLVVLGRGFFEILNHPELLPNWRGHLFALHPDWTSLLIAAGLIFPKLALGLSGFETGVSVMPLVSGGKKDQPEPQHLAGDTTTVVGPAESRVPWGRIGNARKLLAAAAFIMSFYLLLSSFVTTLLIPEHAYHEGGDAAGRAIAYLAHELLGHGFGTVYDIVTIMILWFAGASAMAGLLNLIPRYLPRFGMAPRWVAHRRPLVLVIFALCVIVTIVFKADVEAQGGAYATGVLALILSASTAVSLANWHEYRQGGGVAKAWLSIYFWVMTVVFGYTFVENIIERPDGIIISSIFILIVLSLSGISRYLRATELRVTEIEFTDSESAELWKNITGKKINLVPLARAKQLSRKRKEEEIRRYYQAQGPLAFIHVDLIDNRSEFLAPVQVRVRRDGGNYIIDVTGAVAIANTIAYISELLDPVSIFLGLTRKSLMSQSFRYLIWGEGETGLMVYQILLRYWDWTPEDDVRPLIFLMSE